MQLVKTTCVALIFLLASKSEIYSQADQGIKEINLWGAVNQTVMRHFGIGAEPLNDSCYFSQSFLKLSFDKKSKLKTIEFSDNADNWLKEELNRAIKGNRFDHSKLDSIAKRERLKNMSVIFPFVVTSWEYPCKALQSLLQYDPRWFIFGGIRLKGNVLLSKEITISIITKPIQ